MNFSWNFTRSALAVLVLLTLPLAASAAEERCDDLGNACVCSEPFNTASYDSYQCDRLSCVDPADTTTKECSGEFSHGYAWYGGELLEVVPTPGTAFNLPAGNSVDYVWRSNSRGNLVHHVLERNGVTDSTRRICTRHYFNTSYDYNDGSGSCTNRKHIDLAIGNGRRVFFQRDGGPGYRLEMPGYSSSSGNTWGTGDLTQQDCASGWCRVELCIDGDVKNLRNLSVDGYIAQAGGTKQAIFQRKFIGDAPGGSGYGHSWILNMWREGSNCTGYRQYTHLMFSSWDTAAGQTIGPACEVEGVCDGSSPTGGGGSDSPPPASPLGPPGRPYLVN